MSYRYHNYYAVADNKPSIIQPLKPLEENKGWDDHLLDQRSEVDYTQIEFISKLGEGAFGTVSLCKLWGLQVAVKQLKNPAGTNITDFIHEVNVLKSLRHPNLLLFLGWTREPLTLVTEYMPKGSLYDILHNQCTRLTAMHRMKVAMSVASGMAYLHDQKPALLHRDLKSSNILVDDSWVVKVGDYGLAGAVTRPIISDYSTTVQWRAPEANLNYHTTKSDVYSYGVLLWELVSRETPFPNLSTREVIDTVKAGGRPPIPDVCPDEWTKLIQACWDQEPSNRPSFAEIIETLKGFSDYNEINFYRPYRVVPLHNLVRLDEIFYSTAQLRLLSFNLKSLSYVYPATVWSSMFALERLEEGARKLVKEVVEPLAPKRKLTVTLIDKVYGKSFHIALYMPDPKSEGEHQNYTMEGIPTPEDPSPQPGERLKEVFRDYYILPLVVEDFDALFFNVNPNSTFATVSVVMLEVGQQLSAIQAYRSVALPALEAAPGWRGSIILADYYTGKSYMVNLWENEEAANKARKGGVIQTVFGAVGTNSTAMPVTEHYDVHFASIQGDASTTPFDMTH